MRIDGKVAIVTGAASGIGAAVARALLEKGAVVAGVDTSPKVTEGASDAYIPFQGDTTDSRFRKDVFDEMQARFGTPTILVPAAGITRDGLAVKIDKETRRPTIYPEEVFRQVLEVNLLAPTYWALQMVAGIAARDGKWTPGQDVRGTVVFIGSIIAQGNKGQIAYSATKRALEAVAASLMKEAMFYGVRTGIVHPGYTDTPMVQSMGQELVDKLVIPFTQLKRLVSPAEVAEAVCFMLANSAVTKELWVDAGWHPAA